ncbi:MAG: hypothetical protein RI973_1332 [Bacteroidota bacterium]|jgi:photosystem II stability/assembly factor-like uncharacterized protein
MYTNIHTATQQMICRQHKALAALVISFFIASQGYSQRWIEMAEQSVNFFTVRDSFYKEWEGKPYERGKGYKQFKRWEWFMEQRVGPDGTFDPTRAWRETEKFKAAKYPQSKNLPPVGVTWTPLGPTSWTTGAGWNAGNGRINVVVQDPVNSNIIYVGAASGGLWKSTDGGTTWTPLTDNQAVLGVSGIAIDPANPNTIYIGTGDGDGFDTYGVGVLKSTDGGITWNTTGLSITGPYDYLAVKELLMHPANPGILFAATTRGLYKTTDAAATWTKVLTGTVSGFTFEVGIQDVKFHPSDPNIIYACTDEFFRSTDGGNTFTQITSGLPAASSINRFKIAVSADEPDWVYVVGGKEYAHTFQGIYRSTDAGQNFNTGTNAPNMFGYSSIGADNLGQSWYDMAIVVNPADANEVYIGGINIWKSTDGGTSFTIKTQWEIPNPIGYVHADIHDLTFHGTRLYVGSDGGIYKSEDFGNNWTNLSAGLSITQFYDIGFTSQNSSLLIGGSQDNGTNIYNGSPTWNHVIGADGMTCAFNPANPNTIYGSIQLGEILKSTNGGVSFSTIVQPSNFSIHEQSYWVTPFALDPVDTNKIFVGYGKMYRSADGGQTWSADTVGNLIQTRVIKIAPSNTNIIYIAKDRRIYKSTNGGLTWVDRGSNFPSYFTITDIAIHPQDPDKIWITNSLNEDYQVIESKDGGLTWKNISGNLPALPAMSIAVQPNSNDRLYVGLDVGIYTKDASEINWTPLNNGFPNVIVQEIEINDSAGKLQVGTYGRGAWMADIPWSEYCLPSFSNACSGGVFIDGVVFNGINNTGSGCAVPGTLNFTDYTSMRANLAADTSYPITLTAGPNNGLYFSAMLDFNADGDFADAGEFFDIGFASAGSSVSGTIVVPPTVATGTTTLRILGRSGMTPLTQAAICGAFGQGEVEDYSVVFFVPNCTRLTSPLHGAINVPLDASLSWEPALGVPAVTGYLLDVGTSTGSKQILNSFDVGNVTTFDLPSDFQAKQDLFVTIRPYNTSATATCPEENFKTVANPFPLSCLPQYQGNCGSNYIDYIDGVVFNTISNLGSGCPAPGPSSYSDFTSISTNVERGKTYSLTVSCGQEREGYYIAALIDLNQDGLFSHDEFYDIGWAKYNGSVTGSITLPMNTALGTTRLRIVSRYLNMAILFSDLCNSFFTLGEVEDYTLNIAAPACTALTSPANGATAVPVNSALTWAAATGAVAGYRLDVGTSPGGTDILNHFDVGNVTTFNPAGDFPFNATIYVAIYPYNGNGSPVSCTEESFSTETQLLPPGCTVLSAPANGATNVAVASTLTWTAATGTVVGYRLDVGTTPGGTEILNNFDAGNATTFDPSGDLPYNTTIYVTIKPYNASGPANGCTQESFATRVCIPNLTLSNLTIQDGVYRSEGPLTASVATVASGSSVTLRSDTRVSLEQDFTVLSGGMLEVSIEACPVNLLPELTEED